MTAASPSTTALRREEVLAILAAHQEEFKKLGVKSLALFGSVARNEARPDSDVDLLVEFEEGQEPQGFDYFGFNQHFEKVLGREVELADPHRLKPRIRDRILDQAIPIFPPQPSYKINRSPMPESSFRKDWKLYIDDMLQNAEKVLRYTQGFTFEQVQADELRLDAVERAIITIGEAADKLLKLTPEITQTDPDIPWNLMKGMRNRLVHGYDRIDGGKLKLTIEESIPRLVPQLKRLLEKKDAITPSPPQLWNQYSQEISTPIDGKKLTEIAARALDDELDTKVITQMLMESAHLRNLAQQQGPEQAQEFARLVVKNAQIQQQHSQFPQRDQGQEGLGSQP